MNNVTEGPWDFGIKDDNPNAGTIKVVLTNAPVLTVEDVRFDAVRIEHGALTFETADIADPRIVRVPVSNVWYWEFL